MKKFKIEIEQKTSKTLEILAEDKMEAIKIIDNIYQKYKPFFDLDDVKSKEVLLLNETDIDKKYIEKVDLIDGNLLVCELEENKYHMFEDADFSIYDMGIIRKEKEFLWITNIFYTDDCPEEEENIIFYFKPTREFGVLDYQKYKAKSVKELFLLEKELYSLYPKFNEIEDSSYFVLKTDIPFQELTSGIIHELQNQNNKIID